MISGFAPLDSDLLIFATIFAFGYSILKMHLYHGHGFLWRQVTELIEKMLRIDVERELYGS